MSKRRYRKLAGSGLGALALAGLIAGPAGAQTSPRAVAESACTEQFPYSIRGRSLGFPANIQVAALWREDLEGITYPFWYTTDADGNGLTTQVYEAARPFSGWGRHYHDLNENGIVDPGEPLIFAGTVNVTMPCVDTPVTPK